MTRAETRALTLLTEIYARVLIDNKRSKKTIIEAGKRFFFTEFPMSKRELEDLELPKVFQNRKF